MDKLRALQYAVLAAEGGSLSHVARCLDITPAAVSKQIGALERELGFRLFDRHSNGLVLTAPGSAYLDACRAGLQQLELAEESARQSVSALQGTVVVGVMPSVAQEVLCDALPQFHALHPGIRIDLRYFMQRTKEQLEGVDVTLSVGWPNDDGGLVARSLGAVGLLVCASPEYLRRNAPIRHPSDLAHHPCLVLRGRRDTLRNLWRFRRGEEQVDVPVQGWICSDNGHRDTLLRLATAGHGFVRLLDWRTRPDSELATGKVLPVLTDWESVDVPGVYLHYPPTVRKTPRVRAFIEFAEKLFGGLGASLSASPAPSDRPSWLASRHRKVGWTARLRP